jgi:cell division protein FtsB|tara:strand:+ start:329 stop:520 length:192 start_codon:yes stop_codon:yes gene_type:complete
MVTKKRELTKKELKDGMKLMLLRNEKLKTENEKLKDESEKAVDYIKFLLKHIHYDIPRRGVKW